MKIRRLIVILCLLVLCGACVPKPPVSTEPAAVGVEDGFFEAAEQLYAAGDYPEALDVYRAFLSDHPEHPLAPAALMKIGKINSILENDDEARRAYMRLISEYPDSSFNPDAWVEILHTYYHEGNYDDVIEQAPDVLQNLDSQPHIFRAYALVGDAYMGLGEPVDAFRFYLEARQIATDFEQEAISDKLKAAVARLDSEQILELLQEMENEVVLGHLMFQLGLNYAVDENYPEALVALGKFIDRFPEHADAPLAQDLIQQIKGSALLGRYTVGCLLPLSGPYQPVGYRALKGIELAVDRFGIKAQSPQMNIVVKDSGGSPDQTRVAMQELIDAQVAAVIGPIVTAEVAAAVAQERKIPIITLTQKDGVALIGDYVFRNFITPQIQVNTLVDYATVSLGLKRFAILYPNETYGITFMNLFWDRLIENGAKVVGLEAYNPLHTDFADPIKKLAGLYYEIPEDLKEAAERYADQQGDHQSRDRDQDGQAPQKNEEEEPEAIVDFDAVFIPDAPKTAGLIIPQLAFYDIKDVYLLGTNLWHSDELIKMAASYVQGAIMPDGFFAENPEPVVQDFVRDFEDAYEEKPGFIEAVVYDAAMMLFTVLVKPDLRFKSELRNELLNLTDFVGVTGPTRFDENGEAQKRLHLLQVRGNKFVELQP